MRIHWRWWWMLSVRSSLISTLMLGILVGLLSLVAKAAMVSILLVGWSLMTELVWTLLTRILSLARRIVALLVVLRATAVLILLMTLGTVCPARRSILTRSRVLRRSWLIRTWQSLSRVCSLLTIARSIAVSLLLLLSVLRLDQQGRLWTSQGMLTF